MVVILAWAKYFGPKPPIQRPQTNRPAQTSPATPGSASAVPPIAGASQKPPASTVAATAASTPANVPRRGDSQERTITIENNLYRVEFSNQGAVVRSWKLKKYLDDAKPQRVLDVVHPEASQQTGGWPFAVILDDEQLQNAANGGLYQVSTPASTLDAPTDVEFTWSDGQLEVTKHFHFDHSYLVRVETSAKRNGNPTNAGLAWLGGFGDCTVANPAPIDRVTTYYSEGGKITNYSYKKLEDLDKWGPGLWQRGKDFVGIEDTYFAAVFLPPSGSAPGTLETRYWKAPQTVKVCEQATPEALPEVAAASSSSTLGLRVYVGPKDYDDLKKMNPPLQGLVNFGWLEFIAEPLFHGLKWLHSYIPNWGR